MQSFFEIAPLFLLFFVGGLSMRSFAQAKRLNTIELWLTLPISEGQLALGKFLGGVLMLLLA